MNKTNSKTPTLTLACDWATSACFRGNEEGAKLFELQTKTRPCKDTSSYGDSANNLSLFFFFFSSTAPLTPMESPWSTEVVALRAGWPCWPLAADSYRNTKTHLIGWDSLYPGKSLLGVIVFCIHKRLFDSCHFFPRNRDGLSEMEGDAAQSARKKKMSWVKTMRCVFLQGCFSFSFLFFLMNRFFPPVSWVFQEVTFYE